MGHVFADKTGTLTKNAMTMVQWCVRGTTLDLRPELLVRPDNFLGNHSLDMLALLAVVVCNTVQPIRRDNAWCRKAL